jgi:hypothetical protein
MEILLGVDHDDSWRETNGKVANRDPTTYHLQPIATAEDVHGCVADPHPCTCPLLTGRPDRAVAVRYQRWVATLRVSDEDVIAIREDEE